MGSPVSDDGRGLKQADWFTCSDFEAGSPVSDDGRGLKRSIDWAFLWTQMGSPVSDDGRGLKHSTCKRLKIWLAGIARQ